MIKIFVVAAALLFTCAFSENAQAVYSCTTITASSVNQLSISAHDICFDTDGDDTCDDDGKSNRK